MILKNVPIKSPAIYGNLLNMLALRTILILMRLPTVHCNDLPLWITESGRFVTLNHQPALNDSCDFRAYVEFFAKVQQNIQKKLAPKHVYGDVVGINEKMDPAKLCMRTDSVGYIDMNQYDCLPKQLNTYEVDGYCGCGRRWSQIDFNDKRSYIGLDKSYGSYEYLRLLRLNKLLVAEDQGTELKCVASRFGHCTVTNTKNVTDCAKGYKCLNQSISNPLTKHILKNSHTGDWYGLCLNDDTIEGIYDASVGMRVTANIIQNPEFYLIGWIILKLLQWMITGHHCHNHHKCHDKMFNSR